MCVMYVCVMKVLVIGFSSLAIIMRHRNSLSNENGTWKHCLLREEAKLARNTHLYTFST